MSILTIDQSVPVVDVNQTGDITLLPDISTVTANFSVRLIPMEHVESFVVRPQSAQNINGSTGDQTISSHSVVVVTVEPDLSSYVLNIGALAPGGDAIKSLLHAPLLLSEVNGDFPNAAAVVDGPGTHFDTSVESEASFHAAVGLLIFGHVGTVASAATKYLYPGAATAATTEVGVAAPQALTIAGFTVKSTVAPSGSLNDVYTLRKNGVDTALTATLHGTAVTVSTDPTLAPVAFAAGDIISLKQVSDTSSANANPMVSLRGY